MLVTLCYILNYDNNLYLNKTNQLVEYLNNILVSSVDTQLSSGIQTSWFTGTHLWLLFICLIAL